MSFFFPAVALFVAVLDWIAAVKNLRRLEYFAKPGVMIVLLAWLWQVNRFGGWLLPFSLGVFFSMWGDIFLMLPRERFIAGLVSFLLAHIAYLVGLNLSPPPLNLASAILVVLIIPVMVSLYRRIAAGLEASGQSRLKTPVLVYSIVISLMLLSALLTLVRPTSEWSTAASLSISAGALLFFISDSFLAWNKFVEPLSYGKLRVHLTYHLGQILIVMGAVLHFLSQQS